MTEPTCSPAAASGAKVTRRRRKKLAPSQKNEVFTAVLTSSATRATNCEQAVSMHLERGEYGWG